jgi:hypothetical protein
VVRKNRAGHVHKRAGKAASAGKIGDVMDHLEGALMAALEPLLNRQGPRWRSGVEEYVQESLTRGYGEELSMIGAIAEALDRVEAEIEELRDGLDE